MLTKSRSDGIARRSALSAPEDYLPRLLLCSGLPRASLLTMVDRLGRLGDASENKDAVYANLLRSCDESRYDLAQGSDLSRALLGRLSAYFRLYGGLPDCNSSAISTTFLEWLKADCKSKLDVSPNKVKNRKGKAAVSASILTLSSVASAIGNISNGILDALPGADITSNLDLEQLKRNESSDGMASLDLELAEEDIKTFMVSCLRDNRIRIVDSWIEARLAKAGCAPFHPQSDDLLPTELAINLLQSFLSLEQQHSDTSTLILKWIPKLTRTSGNSGLWELLFRSTSNEANGITLDSVAAKCLLCWSTLHASQCIDWMLKVGCESGSLLDYQRLVLFLVSACEQPSVQTEAFSEESLNCEWAGSKDFVVATATIGVRSLSLAPTLGDRALRRRNSLPPSLLIFLLVSRCGKKQLRSVCDVLLQKLSTPEMDDALKKRLELILLRIYLCHPTWMDLGSADMRTILMSTAERASRKWTNWRASFDDKIDDMLYTLSLGETRVMPNLADLCRRHPLLILRKLPYMSRLLDEDGALPFSDYKVKRDVITGQDPSGSLEVNFHEHKRVTLRIQHWGYSYLETLWISLLDVLSATPPQVMFTCGPKVGLLEFLGVYVELLSVQMELLVENRTTRLKDKMDDFFAKFRQHGRADWSDWLLSTIDGVEVRHLLVTCSLMSPDEAIGARKNV
jgi:hypothetical protein